jgi:hypothetical protein
LTLTKPWDIKRFYSCGAKTEMARGHPTIFHRPDCKLTGNYDETTRTNQAEREKSGVRHGTYAACFTMPGKRNGNSKQPSIGPES